MPPVLFLIPNSLASPGEAPDLLPVIPLAVLQQAAQLDYFVAENAKSARACLLAVNKIVPLAKPIQQIEIAELNVNTPDAQLNTLLQPLLAGRSGAVLSESGLPCVADPGAKLVRLAQQKGVLVKPLVGPSSLMLALMASGLNGQRFAFVGYVASEKSARARQLRELETRSKKENETQIVIETPYRNEALFQALLENCAPNTLLCVASDVSLPNESIQTMSIAAWKKGAPKQTEKMHKRPTVFLFLA